MLRCPACSTSAPEGSRFCPGCGAYLASSSESPTRTVRGKAGPARLPSSSPFDQGRFLPGTVLAGRYRIFGLLGKGGMGEVYRADDLKLGQAVALKFLPENVAKDEARLSRFLNEVKIARQISHPNVCRMYDVGEVEGHHFLSMEYVDGEDLAGLLRRIGRFPKDKAIQIARQLCAGLSAAHEQGILHRDLKPANLMIDGRGRARITDFGLAGLAEDSKGARAPAGTPGYLAPELFAGAGASVKSDLYALGLVLFEIFTGQPAFRAATAVGMASLHQETTPTSPSTLIEGFDPAVERVILRCLEKDPRLRPASALAVSAGLPGGDPLAAALAAGETPSPEMVAAAGEAGGLKPGIAVACLAAIVASFPVAAWLTPKVMLYGRVPLEKPPEVLAERARQIVSDLGYPARPVGTAWWFFYDDEYLQWVEEHDKSPNRWKDLPNGRPLALGFEYRQSPRYLFPWRSGGRVTRRDPPEDVSGMARVQLDTTGRLQAFDTVPDQIDPPETLDRAPDWSRIFTAAGLDLAAFKPVESTWVPPHQADIRAAWEGAFPTRPDIPIRLEAAAYKGTPVSFRIIAPWTRPERMQEFRREPSQQVLVCVFLTLFVAILLGAALLARRHLREGRGDRKGAFRLGAFIFLIQELLWMFSASHVADFRYELALVTEQLGLSLLSGGVAWLLYLALEPLLRRRWPERAISWNRLLAGRFRDPLVGRDVLLGGVAGAALELLAMVRSFCHEWIGHPPPQPYALEVTDSLLGGRFLVAQLAGALGDQVLFSMMVLFLFLLLWMVLRKEWLAVPAFAAVMMATYAFGQPNVVDVLFGAIFALLVLFVLTRFGLLSVIAAFVLSELQQSYPLTLDLSSWYSGSSLFALASAGAIFGYAFFISRAGHPLLREGLLPD